MRKAIAAIFGRHFGYIAASWVVVVMAVFLRHFAGRSFAGFFEGNLSAPLRFISLSDCAGSPLRAAPALLRHASHILGAALFFASAFGWGTALLSRIRLPQASSIEKTVIAVALGCSATAYYLLLIGWSGILYKSIVFVFLGIGLLFAVKECLRMRISPGNLAAGWRQPRLDAFSVILPAICGVLLLYALIGALAPETFIDSLYYLTLPTYWMQHHAITVIERANTSYLTSNALYIFLTGVMIGDTGTAKIINYGFGILLLLLVYGWTKRRFSSRAGFVAVAVFLSVPFVTIVMARTSMDTFAALFETLAVLCLFNGMEAGKLERRWLALSAVFCGTAIGAKYLSVYCFAGIAFVAAAYSLRHNISLKSTARTAVIFTGICFLLVAPYLVRNYIRTGAPLYPFGFRANDVTCNQRRIVDPKPMGRNLKNFLAVPWWTTMGDASKVQEPYAGMALLGLLPFVFLALRRSDTARYAVLYTACYYVCWFLVRPLFRYSLPALPVFSIVLGYALTETGLGSAVKKLCYGFLAVASLICLVVVSWHQYINMNPWPVVSGNRTVTEYLSTGKVGYLRNPYYGIVAWANENLPRNAKILFVGESRAAYSEREFVFNDISELSPLVRYIRDSAAGDEVYRRLRREGITHILLNCREERYLRQYWTAPLGNLDGRERKVLVDFWTKYLRETYRYLPDGAILPYGIYSVKEQVPELWKRFAASPDNYVYLYELLSEDEARQPHTAPYNYYAANY